MLIESAEAIAKFIRKNRPVAEWMAVWTEITLAAEWESLKDIRVDFPSADGVAVSDGTVVTVFNVKGNSFRLLTNVGYSIKTVRIIDILTHAEYSKNRWK